MDSPKTSLLLPSAYRARALRRAIEQAYDSTDSPLEICVSIIADDIDSQSAVRDLQVTLDVRSTEEYRRGAVYGWNKLVRCATGDVLALWADDLVPQRGWLEFALIELERINGHGLIGLNDLSSDGNEYAAHWLADRAFIEVELGGVMYPPGYKSWWADWEVTDKAKALNRYRWARRALVEHLNYTFGKSSLDRTYREAQANYDTDRLIYQQRKAAGFPLDWLKHENTTVLPAQPEAAPVVAKDRRKHPKNSVGRSDRLLADGE